LVSEQLGDGQRQWCRDARITATSAITMPVTASHCGARQRAKDPAHRMHTDDEDEREQDGSEDRTELPLRQQTDQEPGHGEDDGQPTR
jgi:hypothetical protein